MPDKKQNPLIGAFRDAAPAPRQIPPAAGRKKGPSRSKITMDLKSAGTAPQAKPPEPSKVDAAPKQSPTVKDAPAAGKPLENSPRRRPPPRPPTPPFRRRQSRKRPPLET